MVLECIGWGLSTWCAVDSPGTSYRELVPEGRGCIDDCVGSCAEVGFPYTGCRGGACTDVPLLSTSCCGGVKVNCTGATIVGAASSGETGGSTGGVTVLGETCASSGRDATGAELGVSEGRGRGESCGRRKGGERGGGNEEPAETLWPISVALA